MTKSDKQPAGAEREMIEFVLAEAREMVRKLEGTSIQRFAVAAGDYRIEIERGAAAAPPLQSSADVVPELPSGHPIATGPGPGPGVAPGARNASGVFTFQDAVDQRIPVLAPLVGTFYRASQPGVKPFVEIGDEVEPGQPLCIVEAMKMMNEVVASEAGRVAEVALENGEWVEFEQVLMYLEPTGG